MPLLDLKTNLKSLKFGKDRPGGGSSGQPYIRKSIPEDEDPSNIFNTGGPDNVLRGGLIAPVRAAEDVSRLTQMLIDTRSPNGPLFTPKQLLLSRTSVKVEAGGGEASDRGIFFPPFLLGQAGSGYLGAHIESFPINPLLNGEAGTYENIVKANNNPDRNTIPVTTKNLISIPNPLFQLPILGQEASSIFPEFIEETVRNTTGGFSNRLLSIWYNKQVSKIDNNVNILSYSGGPGSNLGVGRTNIRFADQRTGDNNSNIKYNQKESKNNFLVLNGGQISRQNQNLTSTIQDFRVPLLKGETESTITIMSLAPNYTTENIENRLKLGNPGTKKNVLRYSTSTEALDKINALELYEDNRVDLSKDVNDLVKFRIAAINNNKIDGTAVYMHFRAFIDSFSDSYNGNWSDVNYVGRGNKFYTYGGFDRKISMAFTVYAQSKAELIPMYKKLNYLASTLAPDYSSGGFMRGTLVRLTMGGYLYEQPGFITSLTYDIPQESTWEIGINEEGGSDNTVKELPHMIKVTGLSFTPIHTFLPQKVKKIIPYSRERYIALSNGENNNYD